MGDPVIFSGVTAASGGDLPPAERPIWGGTIGPAGSTLARRAESIRRTTSLDILWPGGAGGALVLRGSGRDLATGRHQDEVALVGHGRLDVRIDMRSRSIVGATLDPDPADLSRWLIGNSVRFGLRGLLDEAHPQFVRSGSVVALLVDEIPAVALISGASLLRSGLIHHEPARSGVASGVCAGWIEQGSMHIALGSRPFLGEGPPAPTLASEDDPHAWHGEPSLPPSAMRRRRRIDVLSPRLPGEQVTVDVLFRDSYVEADGTETVVHEYAIYLTVDPQDHRVRSIVAVPHVLPGPECPAAAASAQRVVGMHLGEIRSHVRGQFRGTSTCTHLNDALRSLGDLPALFAWDSSRFGWCASR